MTSHEAPFSFTLGALNRLLNDLRCACQLDQLLAVALRASTIEWVGLSKLPFGSEYKRI